MAYGLASEAGAESDSKVIENHKRFGNTRTQSMSGLTLSRDTSVAPEPKDHKNKNAQTKKSSVNSMTDSETRSKKRKNEDDVNRLA
jgi:hypothetical protein